MRKKAVLSVLVMLLQLFAVSCWDRIEVEDNAFILGIAMDAAENPNEFEATFQLPLTSSFGEKGGEEFFFNFSEIVNDMANARKRLLNQINLVPTFEHCQIVLIGEELGRRGIGELMDFFYRDYDMRKGTPIAVVKGKAKDALNMKMNMKQAKIPAFALTQMLTQNSRYDYSMTLAGSVINLQIASFEKLDFLLSEISLGKDTASVSGGGLFKDFKLVGWLSGEEMMFTRFILGDMSSGTIEAPLPENLGNWVLLSVVDAKTEAKPELRDDRLIYSVKLKIDGDISGIGNANITANADYFKQAEKHLSEYIENNIKNVFKKCKQEFETDPFRFKEKTMNYLPEWWKANGERWDEMYSTSDIETEVDVNIRRVGEIE